MDLPAQPPQYTPVTGGSNCVLATSLESLLRRAGVGTTPKRLFTLKQPQFHVYSSHDSKIEDSTLVLGRSGRVTRSAAALWEQDRARAGPVQLPARHAALRGAEQLLPQGSHYLVPPPSDQALQWGNVLFQPKTKESSKPSFFDGTYCRSVWRKTCCWLPGGWQLWG